MVIKKADKPKIDYEAVYKQLGDIDREHVKRSVLALHQGMKQLSVSNGQRMSGFSTTSALEFLAKLGEFIVKKEKRGK